MKQLVLFIERTQAIVDSMSNEQAGELFRRLLAYTAGTDQPTGDQMVDFAFKVLKVDLDASAEKYEAICERNRRNGRRGGRHKNPDNPVGNLETQTTQPNPKKLSISRSSIEGEVEVDPLNRSGNNININTAAPPENLPDKVSNQPLSDSLSELAQDRTWVEQTCMRHGISEGQLKMKLEDFKISCEVRANEKHINQRELKRHFDSWLSINQEIERKNERNNNGSTATYRGVNKDNYRDYERAIAAGAAEGLATLAARKN